MVEASSGACILDREVLHAIEFIGVGLFGAVVSSWKLQAHPLEICLLDS